jgi:hypothetical protein
MQGIPSKPLPKSMTLGLDPFVLQFASRPEVEVIVYRHKLGCKFTTPDKLGRCWLWLSVVVDYLDSAA